jgi:bacterioferritin
MIIENDAKRKEIIDLLTQAYWMEVETVASYIANSINPDGVRAKEIKNSLAGGHHGGAEPRPAVRPADQGAVRPRPGTFHFKPVQKSLQPGADPTDVAPSSAA